jgi:general secretion pathway protein G
MPGMQRWLRKLWAYGRRVRPRGQRGFTLIELMVVISIVLVLISIALPSYKRSIVAAKESVLRQDLFTLRSLINQYTEDKLKAPQSLEDLVTAGYLKQIPKDPFTNARDTWVVDQEDVMLSVDQTQPGITDVHSGANGVGTDGTAYSTW